MRTACSAGWDDCFDGSELYYHPLINVLKKYYTHMTGAAADGLLGVQAFHVRFRRH